MILYIKLMISDFLFSVKCYHHRITQFKNVCSRNKILSPWDIEGIQNQMWSDALDFNKTVTPIDKDSVMVDNQVHYLH